MQQFLLPCSCGHKVPVDRSQAGLRTQCQCGAELDVPTMRGLAELETIETAPAAATTETGAWGPPQGLMFLGSVLLLIGLAALAYFYPNRPHIVFDTVRMQRDTDNLNAEEAWEMWQELRKGIDRAPSELSTVYQDALGIYSRRLWMSGGLAALGALLLLTGVAMKLSRSSPRPTKGSRG